MYITWTEFKNIRAYNRIFLTGAGGKIRNFSRALSQAIFFNKDKISGRGHAPFTPHLKPPLIRQTYYKNMKHCATVQHVREWYNNRREKILKKLSRIFTRYSSHTY